MNYTEKKRLLKLADFLDQLPRRKFDFSSIIRKVDEKHKCAAVACAIGWLPAVFPRLTKWRGLGMSFHAAHGGVCLTGENQGSFEAAESLFGITEAEAGALFAPHMGRPWMPRSFCFPLTDYATPKAVARSIRKFVEWKVAGGQL